MLTDQPTASSMFPNGQYVIPDTNVFAHCMDLIEHPLLFKDVIVLQTVLEELRSLSTPLYNRLRGLLKSEDKRFYYFHNEFHRETFVERNSAESINDRNDRAIREACIWYNKHLSQSSRDRNISPTIVLLTNDRKNLEKAKALGLTAYTLEQYVEQVAENDPKLLLLLDMVAALSKNDDDTRPRNRYNIYDEYIPQSLLLAGIHSGTYKQGQISTSSYNLFEATVSISTTGEKLHVFGRRNMNRSVNGDQVVVEILPEAEWTGEADQIADAEHINPDDNPESDGADDEGRQVKESQASIRQKISAKVIGVLKRNWRTYVGRIDPNSVSSTIKGTSQQSVFFLPMDRKVPRIRLRTRQALQLLDQRIVVNIDSWDSGSKYPNGHFVRSLGGLESKPAEMEAILMEYEISYLPFPKAVLDCLPAEGHDWRVPESLPSDRRDLRHLNICSIDPVGCQDIDDALHARVLQNGNFEVGVHIADVSHFVKPQTAMDSEAAERGTTVYMVDKRIDMLPMLLGTDLCSLKSDVDRFAFSAIWEMTSRAQIVNVSFAKSIIRSRRSFSYEEAQLQIDDKNKRDDMTVGMRILLALSKILRQRRMDNGALNLASPEVKVEADSESSDPIDVQTKQLLETNSLVEEFMLLANISVATRIYEAFPETAMLRRHGAPPASNFEALQDLLNVRKGLHLRVESSKELADSLDECVDPNAPFFNTIVRIMATRCMLSAEYFAASSFARSEFRHYGLASEIYTHWTSPIRRYADVVVHRQLAAAINYESTHPDLRDVHLLERVVKNINWRHRNSQMAGRASIEYYVGQALKGKSSLEPAYIIKVFENGFAVLVERYGVEGLIHIKDMSVPPPLNKFDGEAYRLHLNAPDAPDVMGPGVVTLGVFDRIIVNVETKHQQSGKQMLQLTLVEPKI